MTVQHDVHSGVYVAFTVLHEHSCTFRPRLWDGTVGAMCFCAPLRLLARHHSSATRVWWVLPLAHTSQKRHAPAFTLHPLFCVSFGCCAGCREAAHRSRQREKAMKEQLDEDNILLKEEVQWLHQQLQHCQQVAPQQQHRTAPVVAYAALGPISVALPGMLQQQHQQLAVQANDSDASLVLHQQQQQQIPRQLSGTGAVLLQKQNQAQRHSDAGAVFLQAATPYVGGASGHEQQYSEQQQQQQHALVSHNAAAVLLSGGTSGIMPEARDQEQLLRQLSGFASLLTAAPPGTPDINDDQQQPQKQLSDMLTALLCAASGDKEGAAEELTQQLQGPGVRPVGTAERERQQQGVQEQEEDAMMDAVEQQKMEMFDLLAQVLVETAAALHKAGAAPEDGSGLAGQQQLQQQLQWRLKAVSMLAATLLLEGQQMHS